MIPPATQDRDHFHAPKSHDSIRRRSEVNVGDTERRLSIAAGTALGLFGLSRRSLPGLGLAALGGALLYRGITGHCDLYASLRHRSHEHHGLRTSVPAGHGVRVEHTLTVDRPRPEVFNAWRQFENLPRFMTHLESVRSQGKQSHWVAVGPIGKRVEWDAEIYNERPNELIAWRSREGSEVDTAGSVHFQPALDGRGTIVRINLKYDPPAGKTGAAIAWLFGRSGQQLIEDDLRSFKDFMERKSTVGAR